ncbi:unnamed protein product, partial [Polarella glacialis]
VVFKPTVAVRASPSTAAPIISAKKFGEVVLAESQTYHGWLRLVHGEGWILSIHPEFGRLLRPDFQEALDAPLDDAGADAPGGGDEVARRAQEEVRSRRGGASAPSAPSAARARAAPEATPYQMAAKPQIATDQAEESRRRQEEVRRREAEQRQAEERRKQEDEARGRREAEAALRQEEQRRREDELRQREEEQTRQQQKVRQREEAAAATESAQQQAILLEQFAAAAVSGDPATVKLARDAAKKGGVPTKDIARVFALARSADA